MQLPRTKEGVERTEELGLKMQLPGTKESVKRTEELGLKMQHPKTESAKDERLEREAFALDSKTKKLIEMDQKNEKQWNQVLECPVHDKKTLVRKLEEVFKCAVCQDLLVDPVTTDCGHSVCRECLRRSFKAEVFGCAVCRFDLGKNFDSFSVNQNLKKALGQLTR